MTILVADDHAHYRDAITTILQSYGEFEVIGEALNGRDAVAQASKLRPNVVLLDISMPELDGIQATKAIRAAAPECRVIACSMHPADEKETTLRQAGAVAYFDKADSLFKLVDIIRTCAQSRPARLPKAPQPPKLRP